MSEEIYIDGKLLKELKVAELKQACKERNIPHSGNKAAIVKRLKAAVELDNLKKSALNSEGAVQPNSNIADNSSENDFIKQYLENQRKMLQKQHHRFSSASEAESEDDAPKKQISEEMTSSLAGAMSPPRTIRRTSKDRVKSTSDDKNLAALQENESEETSRAEDAPPVQEENVANTAPENNKRVAAAQPIVESENIVKELALNVDSKESLEEQKEVFKLSSEESVATLKSTDVETVGEKENACFNSVSSDNKDLPTKGDLNESEEPEELTPDMSKIGQIATKNNFKNTEDNASKVPELYKDEGTPVLPHYEQVGETVQEKKGDEYQDPDINKSETISEISKKSKENSPAPVALESEVIMKEKIKVKENSHDTSCITSGNDAEIKSEKLTSADKQNTGSQNSTAEVPHLPESNVNTSIFARETEPSQVTDQEEKMDDTNDVEGVPVITVDTDVLMEEVEELDYDEEEKAEVQEEKENRSIREDKKKRHHHKEKRQKTTDKSDQSPELKKQRKLKRSSKDNANTPASEKDIAANIKKRGDIVEIEESDNKKVAEVNETMQEVSLKEQEKPSTKTTRRRISIKKTSLKRSMDTDQPREKKRKWGKSTTTDDAQITISTESLKDIIDVNKEEIRDAVVDLEKSPMKSNDESEEEGEIVEEVIVEEEVREEDEEELHYDKRNVVASDSSKEKPFSESRTVKLRDKKVHEKVDSSKPDAEHKKISKEARHVDPARMPKSCVVHVSNLVRPFALTQLKQLLNENGKFIPDSFWINQIKSHCFVTYESEEEAVKTREALHQLRWPTSNPKKLVVEFSSQEEVDWNKQEQPTRAPKPVKKKKLDIEEAREPVPKKISREAEPKAAERDDRREDKRDHRDREHRIREDKEAPRRGRDRERTPPPPPDYDRRRSSNRREQESVRRRGGEEQEPRSRRGLREWDMHKLDQDEEMRRMRQQVRNPSPEPRRRRREEPPKPPPEPPKLLDDLFRKTQATPCVYWLPLTDEQIVERDREREKQRTDRTKLRREGEDEAETRKQEAPKREERPGRREEPREVDRHARRDERRREPRIREGEVRLERREIDHSRGRRDDVAEQRARNEPGRRDERPPFRREVEAKYKQAKISQESSRQIRRRKESSSSDSSDSDSSADSSESSSSSSSSSSSESEDESPQKR